MAASITSSLDRWWMLVRLYDGSLTEEDAEQLLADDNAAVERETAPHFGASNP